ncbi:MAG: L,D-transpeptidase/peptidoglycan binding protein [Lachnospiraceae bacterium]|nr:L,D-transpeptidase/peptidoglycan binding protein [Lachnospiraceae bacterium]
MDSVIEQKKEQTTSKSKSKLGVVITISITICLLLAFVAIFYVRVANYYEVRFFPDTTINGFDSGDLTPAQVVDLIYRQTMTYRIDIFDQDGVLITSINAADIALRIDIEAEVLSLLHAQNHQLWLIHHTEPENHYLSFPVYFDYHLLESHIRNLGIFVAANMEVPVNAYISDYDPAIKGYHIIPETKGNIISFPLAYEVIKTSIYEGKSEVYLDESCYVRAEVTSHNLALVRRAWNLNRLAGASISYDWNGSEFVLDGDMIHLWIVERGQEFSLDEEAVADFVATHARENDTWGRNRSFTTQGGRVVSLPNGGYGWRTDRAAETEALTALILSGTVTEREPIFRNTGWNKGQDDIGSSYVELDLTNQHLYFFIDGELITDAPLVSGDMNRNMATPPGLFGITYRERNAILRGATYTTPVTYWMPFNGNIGMHDATWRRVFGGTQYISNGSHGCINLPYRAARTVFAYMEPGFPVICYY